jgi:Mn2+/Fe2+ NRAMP family transporter
LYLIGRRDKQSRPGAVRVVEVRNTREKPRFVVLPTKLLGAIYVAVGIFLAANKDYFQNLDTAKRVLSALLAVLLWPLLLLGVNLHIK